MLSDSLLVKPDNTLEIQKCMLDIGGEGQNAWGSIGAISIGKVEGVGVYDF